MMDNSRLIVLYHDKSADKRHIIFLIFWFMSDVLMSWSWRFVFNLLPFPVRFTSRLVAVTHACSWQCVFCHFSVTKNKQTVKQLQLLQASECENRRSSGLGSMYEPSVGQWMCLCFPHCDSTHCELHCYHQLSLTHRTGSSLWRCRLMAHRW